MPNQIYKYDYFFKVIFHVFINTWKVTLFYLDVYFFMQFLNILVDLGLFMINNGHCYSGDWNQSFILQKFF